MFRHNFLLSAIVISPNFFLFVSEFSEYAGFRADMKTESLMVNACEMLKLCLGIIHMVRNVTIHHTPELFSKWNEGFLD